MSEVVDLEAMVDDSTHNGYMFNYARLDALALQNTLATPIPQYIHRAIDMEI